MDRPLRLFRDEVAEIIDDPLDRPQLTGTFTDDPVLHARILQTVGDLAAACVTAHPGSRPDQIDLLATTLLAVGFHLGREHRTRGYTNPQPLR